jgi:probable HAF family extracellular repeat protein
MKTRLAGMFAIGLLANTTQLPAQTYTLTDLGAVAPETVSQGYGLNSVGQAAGTSSNPNGAIATLFSEGQAINLGVLEANDVSVATAINGSAEVVGFEYFSSTAANTPHAWVFSNGKLTDIHSASLFPAGTKAFGINTSGVVVGQGYLTSSSFHAFVYADGQMVDIGPPRSVQASAIAINDAGQVLGNYYTAPGNAGPFIYANGKFTLLGQPVGTSATAVGINSVGQVAGTIYFNNGAPPHVAAFSNGVWTDLGLFSGVATHGAGINTAGQVVATAFFPVQSYHPFRPGRHVALTVKNGSPVDLNNSIPANSGFTLTDSIAVNDAGEILCNATTTTTPGHQHAVLLTPR